MSVQLTEKQWVEKIKILLLNGPDHWETAQTLIEKHELPYTIVKSSNNTAELRSSYTRGELFLQQFITLDPDTVTLKEEAMKMSKTEYEVLITGETGTGKEILAMSQIDDREGPIKTINCAGIPRELMESILFGHVHGSFTGATKTKEGLISAANKGIVFLDEIGDLPMELQAKLLRAIQFKTITKIGSNEEEKIDTKFVAATNKNLKAMCQNGLFRDDLFARLSTLELNIKPLRDRECDLVPITKSLPGGEAFLAKYEDDLRSGLLPVPLNVRSIQKYVIQYSVLGYIKRE